MINRMKNTGPGYVDSSLDLVKHVKGAKYVVDGIPSLVYARRSPEEKQFLGVWASHLSEVDDVYLVIEETETAPGAVLCIPAAFFEEHLHEFSMDSEGNRLVFNLLSRRDLWFIDKPNVCVSEYVLPAMNDHDIMVQAAYLKNLLSTP